MKHFEVGVIQEEAVFPEGHTLFGVFYNVSQCVLFALFLCVFCTSKIGIVAQWYTAYIACMRSCLVSPSGVDSKTMSRHLC